MNKPVVIEYFSDILCVWAWIAQHRIEELKKNFADKIEIRHYYLDVFGNTASRIENEWMNKGLYNGYGDAVAKSAAPYESAPVNPEIWHRVRPSTSANAHLVLKAIQLADGKDTAADFAAVLRRAFFEDAQDISHLDTLEQLMIEEKVNAEPVRASISNGSAMAALIGDFQKARQYEIKGSPTVILDDGRQTLYGNVSYRVLHANVEELLRNPIN